MSRAILVVDDDPEFRAFAAAVLAPQGLEVVGASRAGQALEEMSRRQFDLALFDGLLPDLPTEQVIARLRAGGDLTPVLLISAPGVRQAREAPLATAASGVLAVLTKPLAAGHLLEEVLVALAERRPAPRSQNGAARAPEPALASVAPAQAPAAAPPAVVRAELTARLAEVRDRFLGKLSGKIDDLVRALETVKTGRGRAAVEQAHLLAHSLHGTAGSFGLADVGALSAKIETQLKLLQLEPTTFDARWTAIAPELEELLRASARAGAQPAPAAAAPAAAASPSGSTARLLLLDDDAVFRRYLAETGRSNLIEVLCASTAAEALQLAGTSGDLDGILIDVRLGNGQNAFEAAGALRSMPALAGVPVAFVSADDSVRNRLDASAVGAALFLQKPLDESGFLAAAQQLMSLRRSGRPQVLVVDDDADFVELIKVTLEEQRIIVHTLADPMDLLPALERTEPDLLLLDVHLPQVSGFDLCRMVRATPRWRELPVLFLSAEGTPEARIACFQAGGDDYVQKPFIREELLARLGHRVEQARLTRELGSRDWLTGLNNRREWLSTAGQRMAQAERSGGQLAVAILDVDKFKRVNDVFGHFAGDRVLAGLGRLLAARFRTEDVRGRWGGEEFVLAFPGATAERAQALLERIAAEFKRMEFKSDAGEVFHVSFSGGVAAFPGDGHSVSELLRQADQLLGVAKREGRDRVCR